MKVSIIGNNLTSLTLTKTLVNLGIKVDIFSDKNKKKNNKIQTLGISRSNIVFFNNNILNIDKLLWNIKNIEIYSESLKNEKILDFKNKYEHLFSIIKNYDLYTLLLRTLNRNKLVSFKKKVSYQKLLRKNYDLIFNCDYSDYITKKFFYNRIEKDYNSFAHVTTFEHKKISQNQIALQVFTNEGPLAFLPISPIETSVVYSVKGKKSIDLSNLIKKYNFKYEILKINKGLSFDLKQSNLRSYYFKNIIAFGDILHRIHPLAGQGFNMTIRDIKEIYRLIKFKKIHGLSLDKSIGNDFEKNSKDKNYIFSSGVDFIYEFFNLESKFKTNNLSKFVKFFGKNKTVNKFFTTFADNGITLRDY